MRDRFLLLRLFCFSATILFVAGCGKSRVVVIEPDPELLSAFIVMDKPSYPQYNADDCWNDQAWNIFINVYVINEYNEVLEDMVIPEYRLEVWRDVDSTLVKVLVFSDTLSDPIIYAIFPGDTLLVQQLSPIAWLEQSTDIEDGRLAPLSFELANPKKFTIRGTVKLFDRVDHVEIDPVYFRVYWRTDGCI